MAANEQRGEFDIVLEGVTYGMRPGWEAIEAFETSTGRPVQQLAAMARAGGLSLSAAATIVTECIKGWGRNRGDETVRGFQAENIKPLLVEAGLMVVNTRLSLMLFMAATGGLTSSGEIKAVPKKPTAAADAASAESPAPPSAGPRKRSGKAPRSNSGARSKRGGR